MNTTRINFSVIALISLFILIARWLPHAPNFTPVLALCLFSGFLAKGHWYSMVLPLAALIVSDYWIGFYPGWGLNYVSLVLVLFSGVFVRQQLFSFVGFGLLGAVNFFLVSNLGVWMFSKMYAPTFEGLLQCYQMGLPFFRATLMGTTFFMVAFYYAYSLFAEKRPASIAEKA